MRMGGIWFFSHCLIWDLGGRKIDLTISHRNKKKSEMNVLLPLLVL